MTVARHIAMPTHAVASAVAVIVLSFAGSDVARAQFKVIPPEIHTEFDYNGVYTTGRPSPPADVKRHGHELEVWLGVTGQWAVGATATPEQRRGEDGRFDAFKFSEIEVQQKLVILPIEGHGTGVTFYSAYGQTVAGGLTGENEKELKFGPIIKAERSAFMAQTNVFLVRLFDLEERAFEDGALEIEREPSHWTLNYRWQVTYQQSARWAFGLEGFGEIVDIGNHIPGGGPSRHRLGPVIYLTTGKDGHSNAPTLKDGDPHRHDHDNGDGDQGLQLAFGVLFGLNDETSDATLKWRLGFEF